MTDVEAQSAELPSRKPRRTIAEMPAAIIAAVSDAPKKITATVADARKGFIDMATAFNTTPDVQNVLGDMRERAQSSMEKGAKFAEEMTEFAKGNVEAMMESGRVAARGVETLSREAADYGKRSLESASSAVKTFAAAKSPTEFFQLQSDFARSSFDAMIAEGSRVSEAWLKLSGEVVQPLSSRFAVAAEKAKANVA